MARRFLVSLAVVFASAFLQAQDPGLLPKESQLSFPHEAVAAENLTACSPQTYVQIPAPVVQRARTKAQLIKLLRESLFDDAKGVVNIAREKQIRKLEDKLKGEY